MSAELWLNVRSELQGRIGQDSYRNWIEPLEFQGIDGQSARFQAPSRFFANWVEKSYGQEIRTLFWEQGGKIMRLDFEVNEQGFKLEEHKDADDSRIKTRENLPELPGSALDPRFRFDKFVVGKSNNLAYNAAKRVAEEDTVSFNPLFLYSGVGLGKTHLMHAIAWEIIDRNPDKRVLFLSAEQFMYRFIQALRSKSTYGFKEVFRSVDVLLVDDVQFIAGKESTQDEFFYTFNALIEQNKQIIISADRAPGDLDGIENRILSRLQSGLMVDIHPTDYELRLGILQSKWEIQSANHPNLVMEDGVLEFLARRISSNVRVLEGALTRLVAFADLSAREISLELVHETLSDILRVSRKKVTIDYIIKKTAEFYNLRISDITGSRRTQAIARPRQIGMYLSKTLTSKSLPEIGRNFGGRDHTTVIHAVKKIEELLKHDPQTAEEIETLRRQIEA